MNTETEIVQIRGSVLCIVRVLKEVREMFSQFSQVLSSLMDWIVSAEDIRKEMVHRENELEKRIAVLESKLYHNEMERHGHQES